MCRVEAVFRALDDANRRLLLDNLFERDGQTLAELCEHLPTMTRFGVMNHLKVLEAGGLVTKTKVGRRSFHYLNPVPIRLLHDRWIHKYLEPVADALVDLKIALEPSAPGSSNEPGASPMTTPSHVYEVYIRCAPEAAWEAIVDGDQTVQYFFGTRVKSDWQPGSPVTYHSPAGDVVADGEIVSVEPGRRLEMWFTARWDDELEAEGPVRMVWLVEPADALTKVRVEYFDLAPDSARLRDYAAGIPLIVSGLKTLLETGAPIAAR